MTSLTTAITLFQSTAFAAPAAPTVFNGQVGITYGLWHCPASKDITKPDRKIYNITTAIRNHTPFGKVPGFHWWGKPDAGYYCLATDDATLKKHAKLLREAGIDFVVLDMSNWTTVNTTGTQDMVIKPYENLIKVWSQLENPPKIVPWVRITPNKYNDPVDLVDYLDTSLQNNPKLTFNYQGKPLFLLIKSLTMTPEVAATVEAKISDLKKRYTIKNMWGLSDSETLKTHWSFLQPCVKEFKAANGNMECKQNVSVTNGEVEQISVATAYQQSYMSYTKTAVPKFYGTTLLRQFETAFKNPSAKIVLITSWNEWIAEAQRQLCVRDPRDKSPNPSFDPTNCTDNETFKDGNKVFVDQYDDEYNRDIEPGGNTGDYYYYLMKDAITALRSGKNPADLIPRTQKAFNIEGFIDWVSPSGVVAGWTCQKYSSTGIPAGIYIGKTSDTPEKFVKLVLANRRSTPADQSAIAAACGIQGEGGHRFTAQIPPEIMNEFPHHYVFVKGSSPGLRNDSFIRNSGKFQY